MACGQKIRKPVNKVAYNAAEITCNDCILAELDRLLARDRQPRTFLDGPREPMYDDEGNLL